MGVKERRKREKENLRQEILDAARELFVNEGYENVSMRKLAERIEYSPTTIYLYFKDKAELLYQLTEETFAKLAQRLEEIKQKGGDPLDCLRLGCLAYVHFGLKHPDHYRVTFVLPLDHLIPEDSEYGFEGSMGERAFAFLVEIVGECAARKLIRTESAEMTAQALWAALHGITSLLITHKDFPWAPKEKLIEHLVDTLIGGLKA
jgi:AcrR family transcriptional regulator